MVVPQAAALTHYATALTPIIFLDTGNIQWEAEIEGIFLIYVILNIQYLHVNLKMCMMYIYVRTLIKDLSNHNSVHELEGYM